jgi:hypothetical protein
MLARMIPSYVLVGRDLIPSMLARMIPSYVLAAAAGRVRALLGKHAHVRGCGTRAQHPMPTRKNSNSFSKSNLIHQLCW